MFENEKKEVALLLALGFAGLKTTPYFKKIGKEFGITKEQYKIMKKRTFEEWKQLFE